MSSPPSSLDPAIAARLKRTPDGLVPAVVQQHDTGEVLMLGWMDDEALARTLTTGRATYWSRSRSEYWVKGETSGHRQWVKEVRLDCDGDTLLVKVDQEGPACHTGDRTCFDADLLLAPDSQTPTASGPMPEPRRTFVPVLLVGLASATLCAVAGTKAWAGPPTATPRGRRRTGRMSFGDVGQMPVAGALSLVVQNVVNSLRRELFMSRRTIISLAASPLSLSDSLYVLTDASAYRVEFARWRLSWWCLSWRRLPWWLLPWCTPGRGGGPFVLLRLVLPPSVRLPRALITAGQAITALRRSVVHIGYIIMPLHSLCTHAITARWH